MKHGGPIVVCVVAAVLAACTQPAEKGAAGSAAGGGSAIRLVDRFGPASLAGTTAPAAAIASAADGRTWSFAGGPADGSHGATAGCTAGRGISGLGVRNHRLAGRTTDDFPILDCPVAGTAGDTDTVHAVELRIASSAPAELAIATSSKEKPDFDEEVAQAIETEWQPKTPLIADGDVHPYALELPFSTTLDSVKHLFIRPSIAAGTEFAIESIRIVARREHLASIHSGPAWQGLGEIYQESLVSRTPETLRFEVTLPQRPWLDLSVGTLDNQPLTFVVSAADGTNGKPATLLRRTVTRAQRWERAPIELDAFAGRRVTLTLALEGAAPGAIGLWGSPVVRDGGTARERRPNVILVWADTLRRDHLDLYGYSRPTSPEIRKLGAEGTVFDDCLGQATWTKVATPAMMTSLQPLTNGVHSFYDRLPASATTMAEVFRGAGYSTLSLSSVFFTGRMTNLHQGFEELHEDGSLPDLKTSKSAREYVDRLLPWIESRRGSPFFAFLHVTDPHDPYRPYPPYDTLFSSSEQNARHEKEAEKVKTFIHDPLLRDFGMPTRGEVIAAGLDPEAWSRGQRDWYDGSIRGMDAEIGRLVERLRALGLDRDTLVVFTGDHGEEFFEHGRTFHGQSVYSELQRLPLVFWWPGHVSAGRRVAETMATIDIMPTILGLAGLAAPAGIEGRSLATWVAAGRNGALPAASRELPVFTEKAATRPGQGSPPPNATESYAVVDGGWKLIHNVKPAPGAVEYELYDRRRDPGDATNVAASHPDVVARLGAELEGWRTKMLAAKLPPDSAAAAAMRPEELQRLKSLGYVQ
ncbi:MAG TPA: sulfatase [Thermoanaerobaculia bacterium]|jgi:arylsulfatase A-like enzyme|nr:sulfatase [Thermoanaerobaculia bacterium]